MVDYSRLRATSIFDMLVQRRPLVVSQFFHPVPRAFPSISPTLTSLLPLVLQIHLLSSVHAHVIAIHPSRTDVHPSSSSATLRGKLCKAACVSEHYVPFANLIRLRRLRSTARGILSSGFVLVRINLTSPRVRGESRYQRSTLIRAVDRRNNPGRSSSPNLPLLVFLICS